MRSQKTNSNFYSNSVVADDGGVTHGKLFGVASLKGGNFWRSTVTPWHLTSALGEAIFPCFGRTAWSHYALWLEFAIFHTIEVLS